MPCLIVLISGCEKITSDSYCEVAKPHYFADAKVAEWLLKNDQQLLTDTIVHNEKYERLCG